MTNPSHPSGRQVRAEAGRLAARASQTASRALTRLPGPVRGALRLARRAADTALDASAGARAASDLRPQADDRFPVVVHFPGDGDSLYQLTQWLWPLEQLAQTLPVVIVCRSARTAQQVARRTPLPVRFGRRLADLDAVLGDAAVRCVLYVNQSPLNFHALRHPRPAHVHLSHGESEKSSMVTNQLKAYDVVLTAGRAARERILAQLIGFGGDRMIDVGRPQLDAPASVPPEWKAHLATADADAPAPTVFWAPTWEGDSPQMAYGTLPQTGDTIAEALIAAGARVLYRPHPRTGVADPLFRAADARVRAQLEDAGGFVDETPSVGWQFAEADACIAEMSSVAFDWLATGKPLALIRPVDPRADTIPGGLLDRTSAVAPDDAAQAVASLLGSLDANGAQIGEVAHHYLGDTTPGAQLARFLDAVGAVVEDRGDILSRRE